MYFQFIAINIFALMTMNKYNDYEYYTQPSSPPLSPLSRNGDPLKIQ